MILPVARNRFNCAAPKLERSSEDMNCFPDSDQRLSPADMLKRNRPSSSSSRLVENPGGGNVDHNVFLLNRIEIA